MPLNEFLERAKKLGLKICGGCKKALVLSEYHKQTKSSDGLQTYCKECLKIRQRLRYKKNRQKEINKSKVWNKNNPDKCAASMRMCRERKPEHFKNYNKEWKRKNPDKVKAWDSNKSARRRIQKNSIIYKITGEDWALIKEKQNFLCFYCKKRKILSQDHTIPLINGGNHIKENIVAACISCNSRKSDLPIEIFAQRNWRLFF